MSIYKDLKGKLELIEKNPVEKEINQIVKKYKLVTTSIDGDLARLQGMDDPENILPEMRKIKKRADDALKDLSKSAENFARIAAPKSELSGEQLANSFIKRQSKVVDKDGNVEKLFDLVPKDKEAVRQITKSVTEDMLRDVNLINNDWRKRFDDTVRKGINDISSLNFKKAAAGQKEGIGRNLYNQIKDEGLKLVDRAGRKWEPDRYVKMYSRTRSRELQTQGIKNRMNDYEFDLVKISDHVDVDGMDICNVYEANVYSLSGNHPDYPALSDEPPFHPNCAHVMTPWIEKYNKAVNENPVVTDVNPDYKKLHPELPNETLKNLEKTHNEVLEKGLKTGNEELSLIYKQDGRRAFKNIGGDSSSVTFPPELTDTLRKGKKNEFILVHNHPGSSSFSDSDLMILNKFDSIDSLTVQGHDGTMYRMSMKPNTVQPTLKIPDYYSEEKMNLYDKYTIKVRNEGMAQNRAWQEHSNEISEKLAEKFGWEYKRVKPEGV
jgi:hypothetical protein